MFDNRQTESESRRRARRLSKVVADPLRTRIVGECSMREMSPRSFHELVGGVRLDKVSQAFELLVHYGWLEQTRVEEREGEEPDEVERFYRSIDTMLWDEETLKTLPESTHALVCWRMLESLAIRTKEAQRAGTLFGRTDAHLSWTPLELDQRGWEAVIARVDAVFETLAREQDEARARLAESGEKPVAMTVALLAFESPPAKSTEPQPAPLARRVDSLA
jgi:hypothetical protein